MPSQTPTFKVSPTWVKTRIHNSFANETDDYWRSLDTQGGTYNYSDLVSVNSLVKDLLPNWGTLNRIGIMMGTNITALTVPLKPGNGYAKDVNNSFVYADKAGQSGLANGGTKTLITGVFPTLMTSAYAMAYGCSAIQGEGVAIGSRKSGTYNCTYHSSNANALNTAVGNDGANFSYNDGTYGVGHWLATGQNGSQHNYKNLSATPITTKTYTYTYTPTSECPFAVFSRNTGVNSPGIFANATFKYYYLAGVHLTGAQHLAIATAFEAFLDRQGEGLVP